MDKGYIYSRIEPEVTPVGHDSLDIHFVISENHKVYIRNIFIKGNERTRENVIRRIMRIYPGDVFNKERLLRTHREIMMLNYFGNVIPDVLPVADDQVDIEVTVEEKSSGQANMIMGFSQAYGVSGGGGFSLPNYRGRGQHLAVSFEVGAANYNQNYFGSGYTPQKRERASISFTDPMVNDTNNLLTSRSIEFISISNCPSKSKIKSLIIFISGIEIIPLILNLSIDIFFSIIDFSSNGSDRESIVFDDLYRFVLISFNFRYFRLG